LLPSNRLFLSAKHLLFEVNRTSDCAKTVGHAHDARTREAPGGTGGKQKLSYRRLAPRFVCVASEVRANAQRTWLAQDGSVCALFCATADRDTRVFRASRTSVVDVESYIF
jgi:hypothetical protein